MRSLELTLDPAGDETARADWRALTEAGLPSLALHTAASNRPHVTLAAGPDLQIDERAAAEITAAVLPLSLSFSGLLLFPGATGRVVLVRAVVLSDGLSALHRELLAVTTGAVPTTLPGGWTPHVTLARRLTPEQVAVALGALAGDVGPVLADACRSWDGDVKEVRDLAGPATVDRVRTADEVRAADER